MDRNTIIGLLLIVALLIGYSILTAPSQEEREALIRRQDSLIQMAAMEKAKQELSKTQILDSLPPNLKKEKNTNLETQYGNLSGAMTGTDTTYAIENDLIKLTVSAKSAKVYSVEVKNYKNYDSLPLTLFEGDKNIFEMVFFAQNRNISTQLLFFKPIQFTGNDSITLRAQVTDSSYIEYFYKLKKGSYLVDFKIKMVGMEKIIAPNTSYLTLNWNVDLPRLEKGIAWERNNSTVYYNFFQSEVENLSPTSEAAEENLNTRIKWIAYKQQFFSSALIASENFINAKVKTKRFEDLQNLRSCQSEISLAYERKPIETINLEFYFGPNHYKTLKNTELDLEKMIPLGWGIFGWVNRGLVIPLFNQLGKVIGNYGIIILLMTIIIKLILLPLTYKSYLSTAKMKILKPQVDEINARYPKSEDAIKKQQAVMAMYKKAGANPMGGCLPVLLQFPILIAMFNFFPTSIELRHESFLWASDLSTYDSILDLPFNIPFYGSHVSLFCLLMTLANFAYILMSDQTSMSSQQMPGMKYMMYAMPFFMLFWFNSYASGLSYYYFLSLVITIGQTELFKRFIDEKKILAKIAENEKKPIKKSSFQKKLEEAAKKRGYKSK